GNGGFRPVRHLPDAPKPPPFLLEPTHRPPRPPLPRTPSPTHRNPRSGAVRISCSAPRFLTPPFLGPVDASPTPPAPRIQAVRIQAVSNGGAGGAAAVHLARRRLPLRGLQRWRGEAAKAPRCRRWRRGSVRLAPPPRLSAPWRGSLW